MDHVARDAASRNCSLLDAFDVGDDPRVALAGRDELRTRERRHYRHRDSIGGLSEHV